MFEESPAADREQKQKQQGIELTFFADGHFVDNLSIKFY
jgi:hypothetical protein